MLMKRDRNSFRATLLAGVFGLALMGVVALPIGTAKAQSNVLVNSGSPPTGTATTNVTVDLSGNNLTVPGTVSGARGNFATLDGATPGGAITLASSIAASGQNITNLGTVTAGSTISLNGVTGQINGTNIAAAGAVSGASGNFATLDGATPGGAITLASSIAASGQNITNLGTVTAGSTISLNGVTGQINGTNIAAVV
jgi:hypothetical protein